MSMLRSRARYPIVLSLILLMGCDQASNPAKTPSEMVLVPAGEFVMGSNKTDTEGLQQRYGLTKPLYSDEHPERKLTLKSFYIDRYEVSNGQYKEFVHTTRGREPFDWTQNGYNLLPARMEASDLDTLRWIASDYFKLDMDTRLMDKPALLRIMIQRQAELDKFPAAGMTWFEALAYCQAQRKRLPTEAEWEKAARGTSGFEFPWGNHWDAHLLNAGDDAQWEEGIAPVGIYETSKSPYGAYDMAGNVWEWVEDTYKPYPGSTFQSAEFAANKKVIRGGGGGIGHYAISQFFRAAARQAADPQATSSDVGFRCAKDP